MTTVTEHAALRADRALSDVALSIDYLLAVTPVDVPEAWKLFHAGRYRTEPTFHYRPLSPDLPGLHARVARALIDDIEDPALARILSDKRRELETQIRSLEERGSPRFLEASLRLYGGVEDRLLELATTILDGSVARSARKMPAKGSGRTVGAKAFARRAQRELQRYRTTCPDLTSKVQVRADVLGVMAVDGDLLVGTSLRVPTPRVEALIQHEVGTHLVTHMNGGVHRLRQLRVGLARYEETQEALAVFAEYAAGGLTRARLAQLAARVVAVRGLLDGGTFIDVFRNLHRRHHVAPRAAFQVVARVFRSGGLTKDAIYLRGLVSLLDYLSEGGPLEPLFIGKLPLESISLLPYLRRLSLLGTPPLRPTWLDDPEAQRRITTARQGLTVLDLIEEDAA